MTCEILGQFPTTIQHPEQYFRDRGCFVDCRGEVTIDGTSMFGYGVRILSMSHDIQDGLGPALSRRVRVDQGAWIASFAILFGCWIQEGAVVSAGAVVSGVIVPAYTMVQGNPAKVVSRYCPDTKQWARLHDPIALEPWPDRRA